MNAKKLSKASGPRSKSKSRGFSAFGAKVRAARAVLDWSQTELASRSGLTQRAIYGIEGGINRPRKATESQIMRAFNASKLKIEDTSDGGFTLIVPGICLHRGGNRRDG